MKTIVTKAFSALLLLILVNSCGMDGGRAATAGAATGVGALTYKALDGQDDKTQMWGTVGAAGGTLLAGELIYQQVQAGYQEKYAQGYTLGAADSAKRQYELIQNMQKDRLAANQQPVRYRKVTVPGAEVDENGVRLHPHSRTIRVEE